MSEQAPQPTVAQAGKQALGALGCVWKTFCICVAAALACFLLMFACAKHELRGVVFENPADRYVSLRIRLNSPTSRDESKGFKAYIEGARDHEIPVGEGAGDLYRYTYWVDASRVNICPLAGRIKDGTTIKVLGQDGGERTIVVSTRCAPRAPAMSDGGD